jgi:hypothetical protein
MCEAANLGRSRVHQCLQQPIDLKIRQSISGANDVCLPSAEVTDCQDLAPLLAAQLPWHRAEEAWKE